MDYYFELSYQIREYKYFFTVVPNRQNSLITMIDNKAYVLLKLTNIPDDKISFYDIKIDRYVTLIDKLNMINHYPWEKFWEAKIDYWENWFDSKKEQYKKIYPMFQFFIGVSENALMYVKQLARTEQKEECDRLVFQHDRLTTNKTIYDYYNPLNLIIDHSSRDIGEYLKDNYISSNGDNCLEMIIDFLNTHKLSKYWIKMLYSRILFPSFFFDYIEKIFIADDSTGYQQIVINDLEIKKDRFIKLIKEISNILGEKYQIEVIPWIIKKA